MYVNGMGFRVIKRVKGVHHTTIINWVKQIGNRYIKIVDTLGTSEFKLIAIDQLIGQLALIGIVSFLIILLQQYYISKFTQENIGSNKYVRKVL